MSVRPYTSKDYYQVHKIYRESFGPEYTERLLKDHIQTSDFVWVYQNDNGPVVGYLLAELCDGAAYLSQVAVAPMARKCGVATDLIQSFEKYYEQKACDVAFLHVMEVNPSQNLYHSLGYRVSRFEPNLYGHDQHGLRMVKSLGVTA